MYQAGSRALALSALSILAFQGCDESTIPTDASLPDGATVDSGLVDGSLDLQDAGPETMELVSALRVTAGQRHACAILSDGTASCWGSNQSGQLGNGTRASSSIAVPVGNLSDITVINAGGAHTCALSAPNTWCWGDNQRSQLGRPIESATSSTLPIMNRSLGTMDCSAGKAQSCAIDEGRHTLCWGANGSGQLLEGPDDRIRPASILSYAARVDTGDSHTCVVQSSGSVFCFGSNNHGQLGVGDEFSRSTRAQVLDLDDAIDVALGALHSCALRRTGEVVCWGSNHHYRIGVFRSNTPLRSTPTLVTDLSDVVEIAAGREHTCALQDNGLVWCWGRNNLGQVSERTPQALPATQVVGISNAVSIAAGGDFSCAVLEDGRVQCWGGNDRGQLGDGTTEDSATPVTVLTIQN